MRGKKLIVSRALSFDQLQLHQWAKVEDELFGADDVVHKFMLSRAGATMDGIGLRYSPRYFGIFLAAVVGRV